jgi:hypothetical protein
MTEASERVTLPRAELHALRVEVRRLRRVVGWNEARARMEADSGLGDSSLTLVAIGNTLSYAMSL